MEEMAEPQERDHALLSLEGRQIEGLALHVELGPVGAGGARYFELFLQEPGRRPGGAVLVGLRHSGQEPAQNWIEVLRVRALTPSLHSGQVLSLSHGETEPGPPSEAEREPRTLPKGEKEPRIPSEEEKEPGAPSEGERELLAATRIEEGLLGVLAGLVPPGGHMMVEYESRPETEKALALGVPPGAAPLGNLMVRIGCGTAFKDWYFPEGWSEGPRKLQGYKALNEEHARRRARTTAVELLDFLKKPHDASQEHILEPARLRAKELLRGIVTGDEDLDRRITDDTDG